MSLEKIAELILKEDLFKIFLLYLPYLNESKILLFLFSICSNMIEYDTSTRRKSEIICSIAIIIFRM